MDKPQKYYTQWKKPDEKDHMLYDSYYIKYWADKSTETRTRGEKGH